MFTVGTQQVAAAATLGSGALECSFLPLSLRFTPREARTAVAKSTGYGCSLA